MSTIGASLLPIATAVGVSEASVRRVLPAGKQARKQDVATTTGAVEAAADQDDADGDDVDDADHQGDACADQTAAVLLPVLPSGADRSGERAAARWGQLTHADPVFAPAARVPLAGLLLAIPALEATGLLSCATRGVRVCTQRVLRPGHDASRGRPRRPGR